MKRNVILSPQIVISDTLNVGQTKLFALPVPIGKNIEVELDVRVMNPSASAAAWIRYPGCNDALPAFGGAPLGTGIGVANASTMQRLRVVTDKLGRVAVSVYAAGTVIMASMCGIVGAVELPPVAEISSVKVSNGGRIDAIASAGSGIVVLGTRKNSAESEQGKIYRSADYGSTWSFVTRLTAIAGITCIAAGPNGELYAVAHDSALWKSIDSGLSWESLGKISPNIAASNLALIYGITVMPCGTLLALDSAGYAFRSTDGGHSFSSTFVNSSGLYRLQKVGDGVLANGWAGKIFKSFDDGITWQEVADLSSGPLYSIDYIGEGIVLVGTASGKVMRSEDNGMTWLHMQTLAGEADDFVNLGGGHVIYSTYTGERQIYLSDDGGRMFLPIGPLQTSPGDWLDHVVSVDTPSGVCAVGGTAFGYVAFFEFMPK